MKIFFNLLILVTIASPNADAADVIVVIANRSLEIPQLDASSLKSYFMGEKRYTETGQMVRIGERDRESDLYREFYDLTLRMTPKDVAVYWAKKVFTGEAIPPTRIKGDDQETLEWVRTHQEAISYIYEKNVDNTVQVLGKLPLN
jgi:hypothetical protein